MVQQILVPLDGSTLAERALPLARKLALATRAAIHLVRVVPPSPLYAVPGVYVSQAAYDALVGSDEQAAVAYLEQMRPRLAASGVTTRTVALVGDVVPRLLRYEREQGIDLTVLGTHPHGGPARLALGPVVASLLRHGTAPLLLAQGEVDPACLADAVVPLDGSAAHEAALDVLLALVPAVVQRVSLVRVVREADQVPVAEHYLAGIAESLVRQGLPVVERRVTVGSAAEVIAALAEIGQLVIMATHAHAPLTHWFTASVADHVVHRAAAAVLLVRIGAAASMSPHAEPPHQLVMCATISGRTCPHLEAGGQKRHA